MNLSFMCMPGGSEAKGEVGSAKPELHSSYERLCFRSLRSNRRMGIKPHPLQNPFIHTDLFTLKVHLLITFSMKSI